MTELRVRGITDEQTECDRCGRMELRCTVIIVDDDAVEVGRYGTSCASKVLGRNVTAQNARSIEAVRRQNLRDSYRRAVRAKEAGNLADVTFWVRECRRVGLIRPDELAAIAALEA